MRALYWSCVAFVSVVIAEGAGCGGRLQVADCGEGRQYCAESNVCCPDFTLCGDGRNGCPPGDCCLMTTSHVVDGGSEGSVAPAELPPPDMGPAALPTPTPGSVSTGPGGGGGGTVGGGHGRM